MKKQWFIIIGALVVLIGVIAYAEMRSNTKPTVTDFASCAAAGNPVMESYPERCRHDGVTYTNPDQQAPAPPAE